MKLIHNPCPGFNCAEAVNFGPPDWLPYGTDRAQKYRGDMKPLTLSHDALLVTLVTAAAGASAAATARGEDLSQAPLPPDSVAAEGGPYPEEDEVGQSFVDCAVVSLMCEVSLILYTASFHSAGTYSTLMPRLLLLVFPICSMLR